MDEVLLLTVTEAARRLSIGRSLAYRYVQSGSLKSIKIGAARRVSVRALEEFVRRLADLEQDDIE